MTTDMCLRRTHKLVHKRFETQLPPLRGQGPPNRCDENKERVHAIPKNKHWHHWLRAVGRDCEPNVWQTWPKWLWLLALAEKA